MPRRRRAVRDKRPKPKTARGKLIRKIEGLAKAAAACRLAGRINDALRIERALDKEVYKAEAKGWADSSLLAEERGRRKAGAL